MSVPYAPPDTPLFHKLWAIQKGRCALCGDVMPSHRFDMNHASLWKKWRPSFDHIRPRGAGGSDADDNLQLAHLICNKRKGRSV